MKNLTMGIGLSVLTILIFVTILTLGTQASRRNELDNALRIAVEQAVENCMLQKNDTIADNEEFVSDFMQSLLVQFSNNADIEVSVMGIDYEKGLLSVKVTEHFKNPNGNDGTVEYETTVIMEDVGDTQMCRITFINDEVPYKVYHIRKGDVCIIPKEPIKSGAKFHHWENADGDEVTDFGMVKEDMTYRAVFE